MIAKDNGKGDFESPEPGTYSARCVKLIDIGTQTSEYKGERNERHQVIIGWELPSEKMKDGRPFVVSQFYTLSLNEKATLRKHLEAWRGKSFTEEEVDGGFALKNVLGASCMLVVGMTDKGKIKVTGVSKLPKEMTAGPQVNPSVYFSLAPQQYDAEVFATISDGIKRMIVQSPEYQNAVNGSTRATSDEYPPDNDSEIPF